RPELRCVRRLLLRPWHARSIVAAERRRSPRFGVPAWLGERIGRDDFCLRAAQALDPRARPPLLRARVEGPGRRARVERAAARLRPPGPGAGGYARRRAGDR